MASKPRPRGSAIASTIAQRLAKRISQIPGTADVHVHQVAAQPEIRLNVDREKASQLGLTQRDVTSSMLISLTGSGTVAPNFWMNWTNGVNYSIGVQTPQYRMDSLDALLRTPISPGGGAVSSTTPGSQAGASGGGNSFVGASPSGASLAYGNPGAMTGTTQLLSNLVSVQRGYTPVIVNHYNVWPVFDVYANVVAPRPIPSSPRVAVSARSRPSCQRKAGNKQCERRRPHVQCEYQQYDGGGIDQRAAQHDPVAVGVESIVPDHWRPPNNLSLFRATLAMLGPMLKCHVCQDVVRAPICDGHRQL